MHDVCLCGVESRGRGGHTPVAHTESCVGERWVGGWRLLELTDTGGVGGGLVTVLDEILV